MQPLIRAASLRGFAELVSDLGGDLGSITARFGIDSEVVGSDDGLLSITAHDRMLDAAAADLGCPDLGLRLAERQDLTILGPLADAIQSSSSATEALECVEKFFFVHSPVLTIGIDDDPWGRRGVVAVTYRKDLVESPYSPQAIELGLGLFYRVAVDLVGQATGLRSVEVPHSPLSPTGRYLDFFGVDVKFNRPVGALCVDVRILDTSFATANGDIRAAAVDHLSGEHPDPTRSVANQVRRVISASLPGRIPTMTDVAESLLLHPRTLQRRLAAIGTTYGQVVDELRRDRAYRFIRTTDMSFVQIADLIGYSEQSTFSHAVRRWFGVSAGELRSR